MTEPRERRVVTGPAKVRLRIRSAKPTKQRTIVHRRPPKGDAELLAQRTAG